MPNSPQPKPLHDAQMGWALESVRSVEDTVSKTAGAIALGGSIPSLSATPPKGRLTQVSLPSEARVLRLGTPATDREGMHAWT